VRIAVTGARSAGTEPWQPKDPYVDALRRAGGEPFAIQRVEELADADGLVLTGGGDVDPARYGQRPHPCLGSVDKARDELELELAREALRLDVPILAICRGLQVLVVASGGTLWQDLPSQLPGNVGHGRGAGKTGSPGRAMHCVRLRAGSLAGDAAGALEFEVNSSHHQAAQVVCAPLLISGWAPDGIVEAVEIPGAHFVLGVQWHPEDLLDRVEHARLFAGFVSAANGRRAGH
jgi:putative glutamine amidotransferase